MHKQTFNLLVVLTACALVLAGMAFMAPLVRVPIAYILGFFAIVVGINALIDHDVI